MRGKLGVVLVVAFLTACQHPPPDYVSTYTGPAATSAAAIPTPAKAGEKVVHPPHPPFDIASVNTQLATNQPYTITVLGDSTGNGRDEWVHMVAKKIAADYGRAVTVHDWALDINAYAGTSTYGSGAPVTIWNGSAAGRGTQYAIDNWPTINPAKSDLTIISHGHNSPDIVVEGIKTLVDLAYAKGTGGVVVLTQNPILPVSIAGGPDRAQLEADTFRTIAQTFNTPGNGTVVIDTYAAFPTGDALAGVLVPGDGVHPAPEGEQIWAATVEQGLQLR